MSRRPKRSDELDFNVEFRSLPYGLTVRLHNALRRTGIRTVGDLIDLDVWKWVDETRNIGFKSGQDLMIAQQDLIKARKKKGKKVQSE